MEYVDISSDIAALRDFPQRFSMSGSYLRHDRTGARFIIEADQCRWAAKGMPRDVVPEQGEALVQLYAVWKTEYWNRQTGGRGSASRCRIFVGVRGWLRRFHLDTAAGAETALVIYGMAWSGTGPSSPPPDDDPENIPAPVMMPPSSGGSPMMPIADRATVLA